MDESRKNMELAIFLMETTFKFKNIVENRRGRFKPDEIAILKTTGELFNNIANNAEFINMCTSVVEDLEKKGS